MSTNYRWGNCFSYLGRKVLYKFQFFFFLLFFLKYCQRKKRSKWVDESRIEGGRGRENNLKKQVMEVYLAIALTLITFIHLATQLCRWGVIVRFYSPFLLLARK